MRLTRKTCGYVGNVPTPAGYTDPLVTRSHTQMNNMKVIIRTHTSNGQDMTTSIYDSALGKFALGWRRKLQSAAQRREEAAGTIGVYVICACMCVWAGGHTCGRSGPQDISALLLVSWKLWEILLSTEACLESWNPLPAPIRHEDPKMSPQCSSVEAVIRTNLWWRIPPKPFPLQSGLFTFLLCLPQHEKLLLGFLQREAAGLPTSYQPDLVLPPNPLSRISPGLGCKWRKMYEEQLV